MTIHRALVRYGIRRRDFDEGRIPRRKKKYGADRQDVYDPRLDEMCEKLMDDLGI